MAKDSKTKTKTKSKRKKKVHPNSLKNLKSFKKGKSGNRKGAPKGKHISTVLRDLVEQLFKTQDPFTRKKVEKTLKEWVCARLTAKAMKGNIAAIKVLFDRLDGKVPENINIHTDSADLEFIKNQVIRSNKAAKKDEKES